MSFPLRFPDQFTTPQAVTAAQLSSQAAVSPISTVGSTNLWRNVFPSVPATPTGSNPVSTFNFLSNKMRNHY